MTLDEMGGTDVISRVLLRERQGIRLSRGRK